MNYEKKYKESLERAKEQLDGAKVFDYDNEQIAHDIRTTVYNIFPELKESEDERIREWIIDDIRYNINNERLNNSEYKKKAEKAIAWLEKQGKQSSNILWHDVSEEPEARGEIFCEWKSSTSTWHSVVFYHADSKAFLEGERIVKNVVKWAYVDEIVENQGEQKPTVQDMSKKCLR